MDSLGLFVVVRECHHRNKEVYERKGSRSEQSDFSAFKDWTIEEASDKVTHARQAVAPILECQEGAWEQIVGFRSRCPLVVIAVGK